LNQILGKITLPIPPLDEQKVIVSKIEKIFSLIENNEKIIKQILMSTNVLRQIILQYAFEGKLIPQDPNDEPASELIKKLKH